jgi:hypothetical protein
MDSRGQTLRSISSVSEERIMATFEHNETGDGALAIKGTADGNGATGVKGEAGDKGGTGHTVGVSGVASGPNSVGLRGEGDAIGLVAIGKQWHAVDARSTSTVGGNGVYGYAEHGTAVVGEAKTQYHSGVYGLHTGTGGYGVRGVSDNGVGVSGSSKQTFGVFGEAGQREEGEQIYDPRSAGVYGVNWGGGAGVFGHTNDANSVAILGRGLMAGRFEGAVVIEGWMRVRQNVDVDGYLAVSGRLSSSADVSGVVRTATGLQVGASLQSLWDDVEKIKRHLGL